MKIKIGDDLTLPYLSFFEEKYGCPLFNTYPAGWNSEMDEWCGQDVEVVAFDHVDISEEQEPNAVVVALLSSMNDWDSFIFMIDDLINIPLVEKAKPKKKYEIRKTMVGIL